MSRLLAVALTVVIALDASAARAQSRGASGGSRAPGRTTAIRAELADVLLQSRQYDAAAREYRALLLREPSNRTYRLNLARALAWGLRFREAEVELRQLAARQPRHATVEALLLTVRKSITPSSAEAARWLAEEPGSAEYRRILARALVGEGRLAEALRQYDALMPQQRSAELLLERAYIHLQRRDHVEAETDLSASIAMGPSADAYILLGDLRRWRGDLGSAHALFTRADSIAPRSGEVTAAFGRLARDERPAAAFMPQANDVGGWQTTTTAASDNLGALLTTVAARRGFTTRRGIDGSAGVRVLRLSDRLVTTGDDVAPDEATSGEAPLAADGYGADLALSGEVSYRALYARARVRAGFVNHPIADMIPDAALTVTAWLHAWGAGVETSTGPAYQSLVTMASFVPLPGSEAQLVERSTAVSVAGPLRRLDVAARTQASAFSDGNRRDSFEGFASYPVASRIALLYSGSTFAFAQPSTLYWDPARYTVHAAGLEYAVRPLRGFSVAARALPGMAWADERPSIDPDSIRHSVSPQLTAGAELGYRGDRWEIGTTLGYGRGRTSGYERFDVMVQARYLP